MALHQSCSNHIENESTKNKIIEAEKECMSFDEYWNNRKKIQLDVKIFKKVFPALGQKSLHNLLMSGCLFEQILLFSAYHIRPCRAW